MKTKKQLRFYLAADAFALGKKGSPRLFGDHIWRFQIALRKLEYYSAQTGVFANLATKFWVLRKYRLGLLLGFDIPPGVFGAGLRINHHGNLIVNGASRVGRWCDIHQGVNIGAGNPKSRLEEPSVPTLGDNLWIGPGAKIYGKLEVGDRVVVGANAVVNKDVPNDRTVVGMPAKAIKDSGTAEVDVSANPAVTGQFWEKHPEFIEFQEE